MLAAPQPARGGSRALGISVAALSAAAALFFALTAPDAERRAGARASGVRAAAAAKARTEAPRAAAYAPEPARPRGDPGSGFSPAAQRRRWSVFVRATEDGDFVRLGDPQPGDWLYSFREPGQTVAEYAAIPFNRKTERRGVLQLQPFDDLAPHQRALLEPVREYISLFFDTPAEVLPPQQLQRRWLDRRRGQYDAEAIAEELAERVPLRSLGLLGVAGSDLHALGLNFVFGVGLFQQRAGVYSLHRYGRRRTTLLRRTLQLASHELGHMFSLKHCVFYKCLMNGTNSLAESDRQPLHLCPVCLAKLRHNLRFDPVTRYVRLAHYYRDHGLAHEAAFAASRARALAEGATAQAKAPPN